MMNQLGLFTNPAPPPMFMPMLSGQPSPIGLPFMTQGSSREAGPNPFMGFAAPAGGAGAAPSSPASLSQTASPSPFTAPAPGGQSWLSRYGLPIGVSLLTGNLLPGLMMHLMMRRRQARPPEAPLINPESIRFGWNSNRGQPRGSLPGERSSRGGEREGSFGGHGRDTRNR